MAAAFVTPTPIDRVEYESVKSSDPIGDAYDAIGGLGLGADEMRSVARRQLAGSIAVAVVIAAFAGLMAVRPVHREAQYAAAHKSSVIQKPVFVTPPEHLLAAVNGATELP